MKRAIDCFLKILKRTSLLLSFTLAASYAVAEKDNVERQQERSCSAIKLARIGSWNEAFQCAVKQNNKTLAKIITWLKYRDQNANGSFEEITDFISSHPSFPDKAKLIAVAEGKLNKNTDINKARKWFAKNPPTTSGGLKYCLSICDHNPQDSKFLSLVKKTWIEGSFNRNERTAFLGAYGKYLSEKDHAAKIDYLIWEGANRLDSDLLNLVGGDQKAIFEARLSLLKNKDSFDEKTLNKIPKHLRNDPGILYAESIAYKKKEQYLKIAQILIENDKVPELKSDRWFNIRTLTAAELVGNGDYLSAYRIAKNHNYKDAVNYVDAEWLAGKIAYIYLKKYSLALSHFLNIANSSKFSVSIAKGAFWSGMAYEKIGNSEMSQKFFQKAALYPDNFYGQMAVSKTHNSTYSINTLPSPSQDDLDWVNNNELVRISHYFSNENQYGLSRKFIAAAASSADSPTKQYLLAKSGKESKFYSLSVIASKEAARRGTFFVNYSYPTLKNMPYETTVENALVFSVIRQESEFNSLARSYADAMGLMQLMYPTAKEISKELNIKFSTKLSLFRSPRLNVTFGSYYLSKLLKTYNGSYILAIAAYNAGPGRVNKWIKKYGDPRELKSTERVVEWIEKIPFLQTREYVQHVLSNIQIYRNILKNNGADTLKHLKIDLEKDLLRTS